MSAGDGRGVPTRIAVSGIDGAGKSTLCEGLRRTTSGLARDVRIVGNLPRAYRHSNLGVADPDDPCVSSFFFNYASKHCGDPGSARFLFDPRFVDYVMAIEEVRLYEHAVRCAGTESVLIHDRHLLDRRVNAYRAGCPREDIDVILAHAPPADLTILLDLPVEIAIARLNERGRAGRDENAVDLADYRDTYLACADTEPNVMQVDATGSRQEILEAVLPRVQVVLDLAMARGGAA